jgi:hypothetical protein
LIGNAHRKLFITGIGYKDTKFPRLKISTT